MIPEHPVRAAVLSAMATVAAASLAACGGDDPSSGGRGISNAPYKGGVSRVPESERQEPEGPIRGMTLHGRELDVADFRGEVVVINVWGSWCPPCRAEAPYLDNVARDMKSKGVRFVGINTRDGEKAPAKAFEEEYDISYPSLYDPAGKLLLSAFPKGTLNTQALPVTLTLDREGRIAGRALGGVDEAKLRSMIDPLLEGD
ncbi:TlpA family protein disulfide reductase [Streptomyces sp. NPDC060194]|uniref:TlpA family protein disulfide reductase n=1 Tax=Streptomyces sp. NPDC060194 TaxID=3347069 RepID=UPI0036577850